MALAATAAPAAPAPGGLHTLRNVQLSILGQLEEHRASLQVFVADATQRSEDSAVRRAEALLSPPLSKLQGRVDEEFPAVWKALESVASECKSDIQSLRCELAAYRGEIRSDISRMREDLKVTQKDVHDSATEIARWDGKHDELRLAVEAIRVSIDEQARELSDRITAMAKRAADLAEEKWCRPLNEKLAAMESVLGEVDARSRRETTHAMDTAKMVEKYLDQRIEQLRSETAVEYTRHVADAVSGVREDILQTSEQFNKRIAETQICHDARVQLCQSMLRDNIILTANETLAAADKNAEAKLAKISSHVNESVEAIHHQLGSNAQKLVDATERWRTQLRDTNTNLEAANGLTRDSIGDLQRRVENLVANANELRAGLDKVDKVHTDNHLAVRAELKADGSRLHKIEDVDIPSIYSLIEQKNSESQTCAIKAGLDYAERLNRMPQSLGEDPPWTPSTAVGDHDFLAASGTSLGSVNTRGGTLNSTGMSVAGLPPLSAASARKERTR